MWCRFLQSDIASPQERKSEVRARREESAADGVAAMTPVCSHMCCYRRATVGSEAESRRCGKEIKLSLTLFAPPAPPNHS